MNRNSISFHSQFQSGGETSGSSSSGMYWNSLGAVSNSIPGNVSMINTTTTALPPVGGGGGSGLPVSSIPRLNPDVELSVEWSPEEQVRLEESLVKYTDEPNILKYIKVAAALPEKTVRDVALRCRWMTRKENGKRRKAEEHYTGKKMKDRKEKPESSSMSRIPPAPPLRLGAYHPMMHHMDHNDLMSCEVGSATRHLLDENFQVFSHITSNLTTFKIQENIDLLDHTRNNLRAIMNDMRVMPGIMSQMPPLPVSINEELANIILPNTTQTMIFGSTGGMYQNPGLR